MAVTLHGYRYSVYLRIARLALAEKSILYRHVEVNPFEPPIPPDYLKLHPFGRVPTLVHDDLVIYETSAITRYVDEAFDGPRLQPDDARSRARMQQIIAIIDSYGYWPMVRQVFSHGYFRARQGGTGDPEELRSGLAAAPRILAALEAIAADGPYLVDGRMTLADLHLAPMVAYFVAVPDAAAMLGGHPRLRAWWRTMAQRESMLTTQPF